MNQDSISGVPSPSLARVMESPCKGIVYNTLEKILERSNMQKALHKVESNKGCSGTDGIGQKEIRKHLKENWVEIKDKRFWVRCSNEQYEKIKALAEKERVSMSELALMKILNLKVIEVDEIKEYPNTITDKKGEKRTYTQRRLARKRLLQPISA
ncbi:MAG: hypothetical protein BWY64_03780 [bacterium ADurb.Bin363]|nr:MAG: hypothetical protein BWY64_03780 [bacterium ADurb.Bin363]